ncbi:hypothetical protein BT96DRAFT_960701 [Gymnopus androsaceus JB14]|uniref:Uncharacterized protein n=1 Tax=Gymnopus androsaceus JB14 TaxID=1447944 RepID=A0A6A4GJM5_9AGAR|nr:hypothetical protein BT96DRAFT_960701 [Gymnopus androsaceus JB14]
MQAGVNLVCNEATGLYVYMGDSMITEMSSQTPNLYINDSQHKSINLLHASSPTPLPSVSRMAAILEEHSIEVPKWVECKKFKCTAPTIDCCCHCVLYNQPDFANVESNLEKACRECGVPRLYQFYPESSCEDNLKRNAIECLDSVPLESICRAYCKGLNGRQAAWAARKYKGHWILPETVMNDLEKANIS